VLHFVQLSVLALFRIGGCSISGKNRWTTDVRFRFPFRCWRSSSRIEAQKKARWERDTDGRTVYALINFNLSIRPLAIALAPSKISRLYRAICPADTAEHAEINSEKPRAVKLATLIKLDISYLRFCGRGRAVSYRKYPMIEIVYQQLLRSSPSPSPSSSLLHLLSRARVTSAGRFTCMYVPGDDRY